MKRVFQVFLVLFGFTAIAIAMAHIVLGPAAIPGSVVVNATMDSEDRFYAVLFAAFGVALVWCAKETEKKSLFVYFLAVTFFVGGLARLVSIALVGLPHALFIFLTVLELIIPIYMVYAQYKITGGASAR